MADEAELGLHARALAIEHRVRIGGTGVGVVAVLLAAEINSSLRPPPDEGGASPAALGLEALQARPGFDQCSVDREMIVAQKPFDFGPRQNGRQKFGRDLGLKRRSRFLDNEWSQTSSSCPSLQTRGTADAGVEIFDEAAEQIVHRGAAQSNPAPLRRSS
jgi:hypothetical protein